MTAANAADIIVVGAGSSGVTLASRLATASDARVLLLEAGEDHKTLWTHLPAGVAKLLVSRRGVRRYFTQPQDNLGDRTIYWPRGEMVGGSGCINGMVWVRGDPQEFDAWEAAGCVGWNSEQMARLFREIERADVGDPRYRGTQGSFSVTEYTPRDPLSAAFLAACEETGTARTVDYNGQRYYGAGMLQHNTRRGWRHDATRALLAGARGRGNFELRARHGVDRVVFEGTRAVGVALETPQGEVLRARHIVLAAGAIGSPAILQRSGVGEARMLRALGIEPVVDLPGVGKNLVDHLHIRVNFRARGVTTLNDIARSRWAQAREAARFLLHGDGLLACASCTAHALTSVTASGRAEVKLQLHHLTSPDSRDPDRILLDDFPGFSIGVFQLRPASRGSVRIRSRRSNEDPQIDPRYLDAEGDQQHAVLALRLARELARTAALGRYVEAELLPGPTARDDAALLAYARAAGSTSYHPAGTCRMGNDEFAVVDPALRVHRVSGLSVADASIMPSLPSSNLHAACIAIGWRGAELIQSTATRFD